MNELYNIIIEIIKNFIGPLVLLLIGYLLGNKSKKDDIDIQKYKELNTVLANMLNTWHYLKKLNELLYFQSDKTVNIIFPKNYLPFIVLKSGTLNDSSFEELETSIKLLKQYDPFLYFELEGIGKNSDYIRTNYILPFLKTSQNESLITNNISKSFLSKLILEVEEHLFETSKLISKEVQKKIKEKIQRDKKIDLKKMSDDYNKFYYEMIISIIPDEIAKPSYDEFILEFKKPEVQNEMQSQLDFIIKNGINEMISVMINYPDLSIEEIEKKIIEKDI